MIFGFPMALFPAIAEQLGHGSGAGVLGLLYAAPALGAFLATLFSGRAKHVRRQGRAIMIGVAIWGAAIVVFGLSNTLWLSLAMLTIAGAGDMLSGIFRMTILQAAVDDSIRGRLDGIGMAVWATGPSLGELESGVVASIWSVPVSVVSGGLLTIARRGRARAVRAGVRALRREASRAVECAPMLAFNADVYDGLKFIHIVAAVAWVGSGLFVQYRGTRLRRTGTPEQTANLARDVAESTPWFVGSSLVVLIAGISLVLYATRARLHRHVDPARVARVRGDVRDRHVPHPVRPPRSSPPRPRARARPRRRPRPSSPGSSPISRVDQVVLLLVILDMVFKPGA